MEGRDIAPVSESTSIRDTDLVNSRRCIAYLLRHIISADVEDSLFLDLLLGIVGLLLPRSVEVMLELAVDAGASAKVLLAIAAPLEFFFLVMVESICECHPIREQKNSCQERRFNWKIGRMIL